MIELKIKPISVNQAWQGRRFKTKEYKAWREQASWLLKGVSLFNYPYYCLDIKICGSSRIDIDNGIKAIFDALVENRIITDDRKIKKLIVEQIKSSEDKIKIDITNYEIITGNSLY